MVYVKKLILKFKLVTSRGYNLQDFESLKATFVKKSYLVTKFAKLKVEGKNEIKYKLIWK